MIVVIQCAASKRPDAGHLITSTGELVDFVAHPEAAPFRPDRVYARPDDLREDGHSWRHILVNYNEEPGSNPLGLLPAYKLYENRTYERLADRFGLRSVYILSAGWGLIRADFLTPFYDITFSVSAETYKRRRKADRYDDFRMLPRDTKEDVVFLGGKDYVQSFCSLTESIHTRKVVFFDSVVVPRLKDCVPKRFETNTRTNWHYECAAALLDGGVSI